MKKAYTILAFLIALEVMVQAAAIAWAVFGLKSWIDDGHPYTKDAAEFDDGGWDFASERGFMIHSINGYMIIALIALILLIVSFFAKIPGGVKWASILFVLVIIQGHILPALSSEVGSGFGALHGLNAMFILGLAISAGTRARKATTSTTELPAAA